MYHHVQPGGGGWGGPLDREPEMVADDVRNGKVGRRAALDEYGVVLDGGLEVDAGGHLLRPPPVARPGLAGVGCGIIGGIESDDGHEHRQTASSWICATSSIYFDDLHVLDDISFRLAQGDFVSLLGPSGCGKSTLLNLVAGLLTPTGGEISRDDMLVTGPGPDRSMVFQGRRRVPVVHGGAECRIRAAGQGSGEEGARRGEGAGFHRPWWG